MKHVTRLGRLALALAAWSATACSGGDSPTLPGQTALAEVTPAGGSTSVNPNTPVVVTFDGAMMSGMQAYVDLHRGDVSGPRVAGTWDMSEDHSRMTFTPDQPLEPNTTYTIHLGGGMMDESGETVDLEDHGPGMGGAWASEEMMGGGMMGGGQDEHMGGDWRHPNNGSYGMIFSFTTGSQNSSS